MRRRIDAHVVMEKIIPRITEEYRKLYDIPEDHESMAVFSADCEDVMWLAVDDATKKAKIKVIQIETVYGGVDHSWSRYYSNYFRRESCGCKEWSSLCERLYRE